MCDAADGESYEKYALRHAREHGLDFPSQTPIADIERNLTLYCGYFAHKYIIGNKTLCPEPFWEVHEFVFNWEFHPDDLEMQLWDEPDPAVAKGYTFELKPADERLPGIYKRFKEVELPRGCQKTSTVSKAYVTISHLRQRFLYDNIYHRIIITSATTTLTEGVTVALRNLWEKNQRIKRLFGVDRLDAKGKFRRRDGIYGSKTKNTILARWAKDSDDATGLNAFSVLYAGIKTETQGQRADEYVFDDGNTKKNSKTQARREEVVDTFVEQINQLDPTGRFLVCNTRQHLYDFGGKIKTPEFRHMFHILHRRARYVDPRTGIEKAYYGADGLGRERYSLRVLDDMARMKPESEIWCEYMNCPRDPSQTVFTRDQIQIVDISDDCVPIEIKAGLGHPVSHEEQMEMQRLHRSIRAYNSCDPHGKEEQSVKGDDNWIGGHRFDADGNWWIVYLACGQWDSDRTWHENYLAWAHNRPIAADYELPASRLHIQSSFNAWKAQFAAKTKLEVAGFFLDFDHLPTSGKPGRIQGLVPWTKNRKLFVLKQAAPIEVIEKLRQQFHDYPQAEHDDGPDMVARCLRYVQPPSIEQIRASMPQSAPTVANGMMRVTTRQFLESFTENKSGGAPNWGAAGKKRRVA